MAASDLNAVHTPDDLLRMPDGDRYELVGGRLVEKSMGWKASLIATILSGLIRMYDPKYQQGHIVVEGSYQCFPDDPKRVRKPDVSFIRKEKLIGRGLPNGHSPLVPDLIAEVVSPSDAYADIEERVDEHFRAGVSLAWVINPDTRVVLVFHADRTESSRLREDDELTGEHVLPGFRCKVRDIFAPLDLT
jgi:Uma2 family endonuclease